MLRLPLLVLLVLITAACSHALPSAAQYPSPVPSAAQPAAAGKGDIGYARQGAEAIRVWLRELNLEPEEAAQQAAREGVQVADAEVSASCVMAGGKLAILVCHYGPVASQPVAQVILWHARGGWQSQLYPQAPQKMSAERRQAFEATGCQIGCYSGITAARQVVGDQSTDLLTVVNLGLTGAYKAEEVQLLRLRDGEWEVAWVPGAGDWNYGHAAVTLRAKGIDHFEVENSSWLREDQFAGYLAEPEAGEHRRFRERWIRKDGVYVLRDRAEEPSPFGALVRVIHYLSTGADEKAMALMEPSISLEDARKALAQKPKRQGWNATRWGEHGFLLDTSNSGKPGLGVRFVQKENEWVLAEIWQTGS